jgi:polar amino acid transport system substrate-binding protein
MIGYVLHSAYFDRFDKDDTLNKTGVAGERLLVGMLDRGRLDLMIGTDCQVDYIIKTQGLSGRIVKAAFQPGNSVDLYLGISRKSDWAGRLDEFNVIIKSLVDEGVIDRIASRYYK